MALGLAAAITAHADGTFLYDDFDRPDSSTLGADWVTRNGTWEIQGGTARGTAAGLPSPNDYTQAFFTPLTTGGHPFVVQADITSTASGRWFGIAFNVDPNNHGNFYAMVMRGAGSNASAAQFRRYVDGARTVRNNLTGLFEPHTLAQNEYFRYRVVSPEPGVFQLTILKLDQATREPIEVLWEQHVVDTVLENQGGLVGLYGNRDFRIDNFLVVAHSELEPIELSIGKAIEVQFVAEAERFFQPQILEGDEWINFGDVILGAGESVSIRFPRSDREHVRVLTNAE